MLNRLFVMESMDITTPTWIVRLTNFPPSLAATRFQMLEQTMEVNASCAGVSFHHTFITLKMKENWSSNWSSHYTWQNAVLFLMLGLPSTLIRPENGIFRKRSSNRRNLKRKLCVQIWTEKKIENGAFRKRCHHDNSVVSSQAFPQTQIQNDRRLRCILNSASSVVRTSDRRLRLACNLRRLHTWELNSALNISAKSF